MKLAHNLLPALIMLTGLSPVFAQVEKPKTVKRISIKEIYFHAGFFLERYPNGTFTDFKTLAPQSVLLNSNITENSSSTYFGLTRNTMLSVMLGIQFSDKQKTTYKANPLLRLGVSYYSGTTLTGSFSKKDSKTYDTLTSSQTGQTFYMDSTTTKNCSINYSSKQLRVDGSLIFRTNPEARWTLYTGIGITAGLSINANTVIDYSKSDQTGIRNPNGKISSTTYSSNGNNNKTEIFRNKNNFVLSTYLPMGIDFRISKKNEFLKRTHVFYELRPGITITSIPELRTITNASLQHCIGLKVSW